jgi:hypothetical protein
MNKILKTSVAVGLVAVTAVGLSACTRQSDTVSHNLSQDADSFEIYRKVVFHNDLNDTYLFEIEGLCSLGNEDTADQTTVICKIGPDDYVKEIFRMGDNVSVTSIQTEPSSTDPFHYTVTFRPEIIIPNIELQTSGG